MSPLYQPLEPALLLRDAFFNPDVLYGVGFNVEMLKLNNVFVNEYITTFNKLVDLGPND